MEGRDDTSEPIVEVRDLHTRFGNAVVHAGVGLEIR